MDDSLPYSLTYQEFEILRQLLSQGGNKILDLRETMLNASDMQFALKNLHRKGLVHKTRQELHATPATESALEPYRVKRAVILAAGRGKRLRPESDTTPKPMVRVHKKRIIETQLDALKAAGIHDITIVRGYKGEAFNELRTTYRNIKFIDNPTWHSTNGIVSAALAHEYLSGAYLIEGDLFIKNQSVLRSYEYASSYCGSLGATENDWYFSVDQEQKIHRLAFGRSQPSDYKFIGIMYWSPTEAKQLKPDLHTIIQTKEGKQGFIEGVPFKSRSGSYSIFARQLQKNDVVEIDTYEELLTLRAHEQQQT